MQNVIVALKVCYQTDRHRPFVRIFPQWHVVKMSRVSKICSGDTVLRDVHNIMVFLTFADYLARMNHSTKLSMTNDHTPI